ncbi:DNRLRE domain-containing protein [Kiritimatiellota bacterium B12222]|nr:DNRLRE domain-containing protein [Kiritimatiellota bacterium B12222]
MKTISSIFLFSLFTTIFCGHGQAAIILTTASGNGADSYVNFGSYQNTNFGSATSAQVVMGSANDYLRKAYLRFDLSSVTGPITEATLTFHFSSPNNATGGGPLKLYGLNDGASGEDWLENTINWTNAPANAGGASLTADATELANIPYVNSTTATIEFTSEILSFVQADTDNYVTFIITGNGRSGGPVRGSVFTKEHATEIAPTLTIIPEPSTMVLLLLSLTTLICCRRRKE